MTMRTPVPAGSVGTLVIASWQLPPPLARMLTVLEEDVLSAVVGAENVAAPTAVLPQAQSGPLPEPHVPMLVEFNEKVMAVPALHECSMPQRTDTPLTTLPAGIVGVNEPVMVEPAAGDTR